MRSSGDVKYSHLHEDLHVEITAFAPPAEAHARLAFALSQVRRFLIPDSNDQIRQEQAIEMERISTQERLTTTCGNLNHTLILNNGGHNQQNSMENISQELQ